MKADGDSSNRDGDICRGICRGGSQNIDDNAIENAYNNKSTSSEDIGLDALAKSEVAEDANGEIDNRRGGYRDLRHLVRRLLVRFQLVEDRQYLKYQINKLRETVNCEMVESWYILVASEGKKEDGQRREELRVEADPRDRHVRFWQRQIKVKHLTIKGQQNKQRQSRNEVENRKEEEDIRGPRCKPRWPWQSTM